MKGFLFISASAKQGFFGLFTTVMEKDQERKITLGFALRLLHCAERRVQKKDIAKGLLDPKGGAQRRK